MSITTNGAFHVGAATVERSVAPTGNGAREPLWDNARWLAITLVVVGHAIEKQADSRLMAALYVAIYAFHMPLFAFLSGRFSSAGPGRPTAYGKVITHLVVPYLVFNVVWYGLRRLVEGDVRLDLAAPYWHLWFLVALLVWRMALPLFAVLRYPVTTSVVIAVLAGYLPSVGPVFDSGRIFGMLPFFVLGWALKERGAPDWITRRDWSAPGVRSAAVAVLVATPVAAYLAIDVVQDLRLRTWTQMSANYEALGRTEWWAGSLRLSLMALALLLGAALLVLTPRSRNRMSGWGSATMYVYMLHLFPIYLLRHETGFFGWFDSAPRLGLLIVLSVGLSCLLSTVPVRRVFRPVVEPRVDGLLVAAARTGDRGAR